MANILEVKGGVVGTMVPTTGWTAPNGMFGATDRNDGSIYGWADSTSIITLPSSDLADGYMFLWGYEMEDSSNGRHQPQGRMIQVSGTGNFLSATTGGYSRDASEDRAYVSGWSFVDNPSAGATFQFQFRRDTDTPAAGDGTVRSFIQCVPFFYADIGLYSSASTQVLGGTTPLQVTGFTGTDGTNITISSNVVSVTGDNKRYLCLGSGFMEGTGGTRTQRWFGLEIDGIFDHAVKGCAMLRNDSNDQDGESFIRLIETITATRTIELNGYRGIGVAAGEGGADQDGTDTPDPGAYSMVVIELNDNAEVFSATDETGAQELALTGPVDINIAQSADIEFSDSASFVRATDIAVNCEVAMDVFAAANVGHARESAAIGSGSRWTVHAEFTIDGVEVTDAGFHGNYNRGNQSTSDCHGSSCNTAAVFAMSADEDIGVSNQELSGTEGGAGDIETQPGWVGFCLINLDTLEASAGGSHTVSPSGVARTLTGQVPIVVLTESITVLPAVGSLNLTGKSPYSYFSDNYSGSPPTGTLTLTGKPPPTVNQPSDFGLRLTGQIPVVTVSGADHTVLPGVGSLTLTGQALTVEVSLSEDPGASSLTLTGRVPVIIRTDNQARAPPVGALSLDGKVPVIQTGANHTAQPGVGSLVLTGKIPVVQTDANHVVVPSAGSLVLAGKTPTVAAFDNHIAQPAVYSRKNFIEWSNDYSQSPWLKTRLSITGTNQLVEDSSDNTHIMQTSAFQTGGAGLQFTISFEAKPNGRDAILVRTGAAGFPNNVGKYFDTNLGALGNNFAVAPDSAFITDVGDGWWLCEMQLTSDDNGNTRAIFGLAEPNDHSYLGDGSSGQFVRDVQVEVAPRRTAKITTQGSDKTVGLVLEGRAPTVVITSAVSPAAGSLSLSGKVPIVLTGDSKLTQPGVGSLSLSGKVPVVALTGDVDHTAEPGAGSLALSGSAPTVRIGSTAAPAVGSLTLSGKPPPTVNQPSVFGLRLTGKVPVVAVGQFVTVQTPVGSLTLTGQLPELDFSPASIILTGFAPILQLSDPPRPPVSLLLLTGQAPIVSINEILPVPVGSLTLTGFLPRAGSFQPIKTVKFSSVSAKIVFSSEETGQSIVFDSKSAVITFSAVQLRIEFSSTSASTPIKNE